MTARANTSADAWAHLLRRQSLQEASLKGDSSAWAAVGRWCWSGCSSCPTNLTVKSHMSSPYRRWEHGQPGVHVWPTVAGPHLGLQQRGGLWLRSAQVLAGTVREDCLTPWACSSRGPDALGVTPLATCPGRVLQGGAAAACCEEGSRSLLGGADCLQTPPHRCLLG